MPGATRLFDQVFVIVVAFTLLQGPTLPWVARRLDVTAPAEPLEIIVDAAPLDELRADLLQVQVPEGSRLHGVEIFELRLPSQASIALIVRDGHEPGPRPDHGAAHRGPAAHRRPRRRPRADRAPPARGQPRRQARRLARRARLTRAKNVPLRHGISRPNGTVLRTACPAAQRSSPPQVTTRAGLIVTTTRDSPRLVPVRRSAPYLAPTLSANS